MLAHDDADGGKAFGGGRDAIRDVSVFDVDGHAAGELAGHERAELAERFRIGECVMAARRTRARQQMKEMQLNR